MRRFIIISCAPLLFFLFSTAHEKSAVVEPDARSEEREVVYPDVVKLHPPTVHFAIALPLFTLLLEGLYHLRKRKPDEVEFFAVAVSSGAVVLAAITGYIAHESMENLPI
jgi:hypothetical protein